MEDEVDETFYDDGYTESTSYYLYALAGSVVLGLPLLLAALFKIYTDHQRSLQQRLAHKEKMEAYSDAKKGLAASLRFEVNSTRASYERERMEKEHRVREARLEHGKQVQELESKIRYLERQLAAKNAELAETMAEAEESRRKTSAEHSREMREARDTSARWQAQCEGLKTELSQRAREAREEYRALDELYRRECVDRIEDQRRFDARIRSLEEKNVSLQTTIINLKSELGARQQGSVPGIRGWRSVLSGSSGGRNNSAQAVEHRVELDDPRDH